jgi:hypothetical protein
MTASGLTSNLQEIVTTPTSFISLDPAIEGPGDVLEDGASVAVSRERRPVKARRTRPATGAEASTPGATAPNSDATARRPDRDPGTEDTPRRPLEKRQLPRPAHAPRRAARWRVRCGGQEGAGSPGPPCCPRHLRPLYPPVHHDGFDSDPSIDRTWRQAQVRGVVPG